MLEVFLTVGAGYILKRLGIFTEEHSRVLVNYVLYFALPLLSFKTAYKLGLSKEVFYVASGAWLVILTSLLLSFLIGRVLRVSITDLKTLMMISAFGNTAFLGYPYTFAHFGEEGLRYAVIYDSVGSFLAVSSIGFFILSGRFEWKSVVFFPPFLGLMIGFGLKGVVLPENLLRFLDFSVASLLPVVLFSLGLSLEFSRALQSTRLLSLSIFIKMFLSPAAALFLLGFIPMGDLAYRVSVLESAMPTMITASVLVLKYGLNHNLAFASAGVGILVSFVSVPLWVYLLEHL